MMVGIDQVKPRERLGDISYAIQTYAEKNVFSQTPG
jgi:methionine aminopeptidase